jgi:hypothetical protein
MCRQFRAKVSFSDFPTAKKLTQVYSKFKKKWVFLALAHFLKMDDSSQLLSNIKTLPA